MNLTRICWLLALASSLSLSGAAAQTSVPGKLGFEYQRLNNCGPMSAKMTLSLYGVDLPQADVAAALKRTRVDRNVTTPDGRVSGAVWIIDRAALVDHASVDAPPDRRWFPSDSASNPEAWR